MKQDEIGKIIQKRRILLSLNQKDLAEMVEVTPKTIYSIENNKANPSLEILKKILEILGLEIKIQIKKTDE